MKQEFDDIYVSEAVDAGEYDYEGDMAKTQLVTIADAAEELHDMLEDDENLPEWCQNKITKAMDYLDTVRDYMIAKDTDEEPGDENPNESVKLDGIEDYLNEAKLSDAEKSELEDLILGLKIYSDPYSMNPQYKYVKPTLDKIKKKFGDKIYNDLKNAVDSGNWHLPKYGMARGTYASDRLAWKKPTTIKKDGKIDARSARSTKRSIKYNLKSTPKDPKRLGEENKQNEAVNVDEGNMASAAKELETYARKSGGIDKNDFIKAAMMMKRNQKKQLDKFVDELDTEPREKILSVMQKHIKEAYSEPQGQAKRMMSPLQKMRMDKEKKDRDKDGKLKSNKKRGASTMNRLRDMQDKSNAMAANMAAKTKNTKAERERRLAQNMKKLKDMRKSDKSWGKSSAFDWHANMDEIKEGGMKRIAQAQGGTKSDRSDAAVNKGGLQTFKKKPTNEKLKVSDGMGAWIDDFKQSDAPQFKGKTAKERRDMAIAAYLSAKDGGKNEDV